jgi:hypothetical protein
MPRTRSPAAASGERREAPGEPQVHEEEDQRNDEAPEEQANLRPEGRPEDGVVADALEPDGVRREVQARADEEDRGEEDQADDDEEDLRTQPSGTAAPRATVVRTPGRAPGRPPAASDEKAAASSLCRRQDDGLLRRAVVVRLLGRGPVRVVGRGRVRVAGRFRVRVGIVGGLVVLRAFARATRLATTGGPGLALIQLTEKIVEEVTHRGLLYAGPSSGVRGAAIHGRLSPRPRDGTAASATSASSAVIAAARAASRTELTTSGVVHGRAVDGRHRRRSGAAGVPVLQTSLRAA